MAYIYIVTNLKNKKQYIGQTIQSLIKRINSHKSCNGCSVFHNAIKKYGIENFKWVSFSCPEEDLDWQETFLIKELNTLAPNGYNLDSGGHENKHHHELSKKKMSEKSKGVPKSEQHKKRIAKAVKNYLKNNPIVRIGKNNPNFGNHKLNGKNNPMYGRTGINHPMYGKTGENHPSFKFTKKDIIKIKELIKNNIKIYDISKKYGVCKQTIYNIKNKKVGNSNVC